LVVVQCVSNAEFISAVVERPLSPVSKATMSGRHPACS
jgi:hypothetical protein